MNCCKHTSNEQKEKGQKHRKGPMSHMWMMALCCGAPLLLLLAISLMGTGFPGIRAVLLGALPFICPIMMIGMIPMMFMHGKNHDDCQEKPLENAMPEENQSENKFLK